MNQTFKNVLTFCMLTFMLLAVVSSYCQPTIGQDEPIYTVTYEVIPSQKVDTQLNTIIFNIPVTEDYFDSININQEVTSWFKTAQENVVLLGKIPDRWKLIIKDKRIWSK